MAASTSALSNAVRDLISKDPLLMDNVFEAVTVLPYFKGEAEKYTGGDKLTLNFINQNMPGGMHPRGGTFVNSERDITQRLQFELKYLRLPIVTNKIDTNVLNKGMASIYSDLEAKISAAYLSAGAMMELGLFLPGSGAYVHNVQGLPEVCSAGAAGDNSWTGATYDSYGELSRAAYPNVSGNVLALNGYLSNSVLDSTYTAVTRGSIKPRVGVTTPKVTSFLRDKYQVQQMFGGSQANGRTNLGFDALAYRGADIIDSRYVPGSEISGTAMQEAVDFITETTRLTVPAVAYPTITTETFWWLNIAPGHLQMWMSDDEEFGLGFTDFIPDAKSDQLVGAIRVGYLIASQSPRSQYEINTISV